MARLVVGSIFLSPTPPAFPPVPAEWKHRHPIAIRSESEQRILAQVERKEQRELTAEEETLP